MEEQNTELPQGQESPSVDARYEGLIASRAADVAAIWATVALAAVFHTGLVSVFYVRFMTKRGAKDIALIALVGAFLGSVGLVLNTGFFRHLRNWNQALASMERGMPDEQRIFTRAIQPGLVRVTLLSVTIAVTALWFLMCIVSAVSSGIYN
jgi:hypothetical protein